MAIEPNQDIVKVSNAEGLTVSLAEQISGLSEDTTIKYNVKYEALKSLAEFEQEQLKELRRVYE